VPAAVVARLAVDEDEQARVRKLALARHAPADWVLRARIVAASWDRHSVPEIAGQLGCHARTVRSWIHRFNAEGVEGLGDRQRPGRPRRLTEDDRSRIVALVKTTPPGRLHYTPADEELVQDDETSTAAVWSLDSLTEAANARGIAVVRSVPGRCPRTRSSSQKDSRHRALHPHARGHHGRLRRRTRPADPSRLPGSTRLDQRRQPGQGRGRLLA
jgi:transposase